MAERVDYDVAVNLKINAASGGIGARMAREAKSAEALRKRELASAAKSSGKMLSSAASSLGGMTSGLANAFKSVGVGPAVQWAKTAAIAAGAAFAAGFGYAAGKGIGGGVMDNAKTEETRNRIGTTLQLFDFNAALPASEQYRKNLEDATYYQKSLIKIADASPGDVGQVEGLFQAMLPGMASITQEGTRILDLTQKATLLSAVLGNRFELVGEQASRMLTGGAGAEMDTWRLLQKPILEAGKEMKVFGQGQGEGEKLTLAFNKLDPKKRLAVFEAGLSRLGKDVADQYAQSWDGITAQAKSSGLTIRKILGGDTFDELKKGLQRITQSGGALDSSGPQFQQLKMMAGYFSEKLGWATFKLMNVAKDTLGYVANNWQTIVMHAQAAAHYLVSGAKLAASLTAARMAAGAGLGAAGMAMSGIRGIGSAVAGVASMGSAALVAAPALLAAGAAAAGLGIVAAGAGIMFGGVIAYLVSNFDSFMASIRSGATNIQPLLQAVDDMAAKFYSLGAFLLGATDGADGFQTAVDFAAKVVDGISSAFAGLLDATAWVIDAFASAAEFIKGLNPFAYTKGDVESSRGWAATAESWGLDSLASTLREEADVMEGTINASSITSMQSVAETVRQAAEVFRNAKADPFNPEVPMLSEALYNKLFPMGPEAPPPGANQNNKGAPKVSAKVTIYNQMNLREMDPNAVVAAFNKNVSGKMAVPLAAALRRAQAVGA